MVNTDRDQIIRNIESSLKRGLPEVVSLPVNKKQMVIVGGGPSLKFQLTQIRHRKAKRAEIWATNGTHDYLISKGIVPDYLAICDAQSKTSCFVQKPNKNVTYFIASQCDPSVFDSLDGQNVYIWHCHDSELQGTIESNSRSRETLMIQGGSTISLRLMCLGAALGYRSIHHYGLDSSYEDSHHAYPQKLNDGEEVLEVEFEGKKFRCSAWMLEQAEDYQKQLEALELAGVRVFSHGTGLIPFIHQKHIEETYASTS
jgi:hypothetical protein